MSLLYHPGKANVVGYDLIRISIGSVAQVEDDTKELVREVNQPTKLVVRIVDLTVGNIWVPNGSIS